MSPSLFSVYINDLIEEINELRCGVKIAEEIISTFDDLAFIAPDERYYW